MRSSPELRWFHPYVNNAELNFDLKDLHEERIKKILVDECGLDSDDTVVKFSSAKFGQPHGFGGDGNSHISRSISIYISSKKNARLYSSISTNAFTSYGSCAAADMYSHHVNGSHDKKVLNILQLYVLEAVMTRGSCVRFIVGQQQKGCILPLLEKLSEDRGGLISGANHQHGHDPVYCYTITTEMLLDYYKKEKIKVPYNFDRTPILPQKKRYQIPVRKAMRSVTTALGLSKRTLRKKPTKNEK